MLSGPAAADPTLRGYLETERQQLDLAASSLGAPGAAAADNAMPGGNTGNGFDKDRRRAVAGGKKSKRRSLDKICLDFLNKTETIKYRDAAGKEKEITGTRNELLNIAYFRAAMAGNIMAGEKLRDRAFGPIRGSEDDPDAQTLGKLIDAIVNVSKKKTPKQS